MRRQELDELVSDSALIGRRTLDPEWLYPSAQYNMQLRQNHEFAPQLAKRGWTVSINDLYRACQEVAARNMMSIEVVRFLDNDTGVIFQGTISIGNFAGQGI